MNTPAIRTSNQIQMMAQRLHVDPQDMHDIIVNTVMPNGGRGITNEQFVSFLAVANEYNLNPLTKEIYAFPAKGGGIQPIVSIDGWLGIINSNPQFDGMDIEFSQSRVTIGDKELPEYCTCKIYRKDRNRPIVVVEYMEECWRNTDPWKQKGRRMLQHKAVIQAARYAFGISGIIDEDEKESYKDMGVIEVYQESKSGTLAKLSKPKPDSQPAAKPAQDESNPDGVRMVLDLIDAATTMDELNVLAKDIKESPRLGTADRAELRKAWSVRKAEIEQLETSSE